jgi:hypothetical protein
LECYLPAHPHAVALIEEFLDAAGYRADQKKSTWKNDDRLRSLLDKGVKI